MNYTKRGLRRPIKKKVVLEDQRHGVTGFTTRTAGYETFDVELDIDLDAIADYLGHRAAENSSSKSIALHGDIKVRVINRRRENGP